MLNKQLKEVEEYKKRKEIEADDNRYIANAWLKRTGWAKHLAGLDREQLILMLEPLKGAENIGEDEANEQGLMEACQATQKVIKKAHCCCKPDIVSLTALEYVNKRETGQKSSEKPFYAEQMVKTIKKYSRRWVKILCWIWRSQKGGLKARYRFTARQKNCFESLQKAAQKESRIAEAEVKNEENGSSRSNVAHS